MQRVLRWEPLSAPQLRYRRLSSGPGPNGYRFEHLRTPLCDNDAAEVCCRRVVRFLLREVPGDALAGNLWARFAALRKPYRKVRPNYRVWERAQASGRQGGLRSFRRGAAGGPRAFPALDSMCAHAEVVHKAIAVQGRGRAPPNPKRSSV